MVDKILLLGATGQVGQELALDLSRCGQVQTGTRATFDLAQPAILGDKIRAFAPDIIVNSAAYTAVDRAETEPELAYAVNALAPQAIASAAKEIGAYVVHISTDYVFDGSQSSPYQETDITNPLGVYGQSKLQGERAVAESGANFLIVRTAWVYGAKGSGNFVKTMVRLGKERQEVRVVADQIGGPTWAKDLAQAIAALVQQRAQGIYHYSNSGVASWYDFAVAIFEEVENLGISIQVRQVVPITTAAYPTPARRPAYSVLSHEKIVQTLGSAPPHWRASLRAMLQQSINEGIF
ncbi:dTDP-4-dehydrorhamnose reductase [Synechocystis sp. LEGE 06083]|uniref:dTDP-4-dehydrorhamnose reductase n=1 Tax=Synechocystis sp. LEGE 06083 TaxID=915336 RepID=UPI001882DE59|nr:dTDP-4-dehydrorhamnose reductase [Synechocystis sp. LEGE 06083]MBE9193919.1 dTDP-4-dehydrorhamnose reductase [Synechocystis sp. LEGE 06083]